MSNSSRPHGLQPTSLLRPWDFPGKSTGVGCHCLIYIYIHIYTYVYLYIASLVAQMIKDLSEMWETQALSLGQEEYIMRNSRLDESQAGIKPARRNIVNLRYADDTTLMAESEEELKRLLMKVKEGREKEGLKLNIQKTKVMAFGPITSRQTEGETMETVTDFIFLGSQITADGDCSHEIKRRLLLGRKVMTNLDSIFKSRDITLPTKVCLVKVMVFPVVMYGCES